jgi:hypothetical protein
VLVARWIVNASDDVVVDSTVYVKPCRCRKSAWSSRSRRFSVTVIGTGHARPANPGGANVVCSTSTLRSRPHCCGPSGTRRACRTSTPSTAKSRGTKSAGVTRSCCPDGGDGRDTQRQSGRSPRVLRAADPRSPPAAPNGTYGFGLVIGVARHT